MVSSISFTSTYKVNNRNIRQFSDFQNYVCTKESERGVKAILKDEIIKGKSGTDYRAQQTLIVPDYMDLSVEMYCMCKNIKYKKYYTQDLLNPKKIKSRIMEAPEGFRKVNVDVEKLEELAKNQNSNLDHCRSDYNKHYSDGVDTMIKSGDEFPATTLHINSGSDNEDLRRYVKKFGVKNLNDGQIFIDFDQRTNNPDHCVYFALKDMGMEKVHVYVDNKNY